MTIRHHMVEFSTRAASAARSPLRANLSIAPQGISSGLIRGGFSLLATLCDLAAIGVAIITIRLLGLEFPETVPHAAQASLPFAMIITILFITSNMMRNEYEIMRYLAFKECIQHVFVAWSTAFLCTVAIGLSMQATNSLLLPQALAFYGIGFLHVALTRVLLAKWVRVSAEAGGLAARRVLLIGHEEEVAQFSERYEPWRLGMHIAAASVLRDNDHLKEDLALASAYARILRPDDIFILVPWSHKETIDACINAFMRVPASIHLGPERVLDRFADAQVSKIGPMASLNLVHRPLSMADVFAKRLFDVVLAGIGLLFLAPFLLAIAIAIKCDSKGPVIFRQRRYGFNQEPFRIFKFRSMTTLEDGANVKHVTRNDSRVTRIGRLMRRCNIDELPQLLNVLRGDMSLVGPRPHALAHDQQFERSIGLYAKRHNVKPGIHRLGPGQRVSRRHYGRKDQAARGP